MPRKSNASGLAEYLNNTCEVFEGSYIHSYLARHTTSYFEKCLNSPEENGNIWDRLNDALADPLVVEFIDPEGREVVRTAFAMALRHHRAVQFVEEAQKELARERKRVDRRIETQRRYEMSKGDMDFRAYYTIEEGLLRAGRLETIIGEMRTAARVLDRCNWGFEESRYKDFGRIPEGLLESMHEDHGLGGLHRRLKFADEVVSRLHENFPSLMAELPSNLLLAEGPEGQPTAA